MAGLVPWWISRWECDAPFFGLTLFRFAGGALTALGIAGLLECFVRFALQGVGTPAPVFPTRHLVVAIILGQGLIFGNVAVLEYGGIVWLLFHAFVLVYEEPTLRASFGSEYQSFCAEVPRWIPRSTSSLTRPQAHPGR